MSVTINGTNGLTFTDNSTQNTAATGFGFKNRIINGAMMIDQRNAGASVSITTGTFLVDRFKGFRSGGAATITGQRSTTAPSGFSNSVVLTVGTGAAPGATDYTQFDQNIEGFNTADLAWGTASAQSVTLSFWVRSSLTGTFGVAFRNDAGNRSYVASYTISAANTWEYKTIVIAGDTTGTWLTDNNAGIKMTFDMGVGSTYSNSAGTWAGANYFGLTGGVKLAATAGATFYITGVQLEKGSTATSFDYRPYGLELALCQRYYELGSFQGAAAQVTTNLIEFGMSFAVSKRASPSMTYPVPYTLQGVVSGLSVSASTQSPTGFYASITRSGITGAAYFATADANDIKAWTASSEL